MLGYVLRRLAVAVVLVWLLSVITFAMYFRIPADPAGFLVDMQKATPDQIAKAHHALGVDRPVPVQYWKYVSRAAQGDFGFSWGTAGFNFRGEAEGVPVGPLLRNAARVTGSLVFGGMALLLLIAIPLGTFVATRPRSLADRLTVGFSIAAISTHPLVVGLLLQLFVGNRWHLAPPSGYCPFFGQAPDTSSPAFLAGNPVNVPTCGGPADWAAHLALPWLTFALFFVALYLRMVRTRMIEVLHEPYVRTARAKGASEPQVVRRHALRNGISPIVTMIGMDIGMAIGIAMYIETVFGLPGLGRTTISALNGASGFDLPVILGITLVTGLAIILLNLVVDLLLLAIDPTISRGRRATLRAPRSGRLMRILLVSQMYPGPSEPDFGIFVPTWRRAGGAGHEIELAVLDHRGGGKRRYLELARRVRAAREAGRRLRALPRPGRVDRVAGRRAARRHRARPATWPTSARCRVSRALTRRVVGRAATVVCVSELPAPRARAKLPEAPARRRSSMGVDLERFRPRRRSSRTARRLPLRRLADRAEERRAARRRVRPPPRGDADLRRRRAAAAAARGPRPGRARGGVAHDDVPALASPRTMCSASRA